MLLTIATTWMTGWVGSSELGSLSIAVDASAWRGRRVRVEGWLHGSEDDWTSVWARVDGDERTLAIDNAVERDLDVNGWVRHSVVVDVGPDADRLVFGVLLSGNRDVRVDNLAVIDVGRAPLRQRAEGRARRVTGPRAPLRR